MKHIKTTSKVHHPEKAEIDIPIVGDLVCRVLPDKDKCAE